MIGALKKLKSRAESLNYATEWISDWAARHAGGISGRPMRVLDVGLGMARDLLSIRQRCGGRRVDLFGVESQERFVTRANSLGIRTFAVDIEHESLPVENGFFDIVLANHIIEHTKELFWIFAEFSRVLAMGGLAIVGCPNLASWHNRLALLLGRQPPCMKVLGPHVRGITRPAFREFVERDGYFKVLASRGSNLYPIPVLWLNRIVSRLFPGICAVIHFVARRTGKPGSFLSVLDSGVPGMSDTPYYRGDRQAAWQAPEGVLAR